MREVQGKKTYPLSMHIHTWSKKCQYFCEGLLVKFSDTNKFKSQQLSTLHIHLDFLIPETITLIYVCRKHKTWPTWHALALGTCAHYVTTYSYMQEKKVLIVIFIYQQKTVVVRKKLLLHLSNRLVTGQIGHYIAQWLGIVLDRQF